eukprot:GEZU01018344.1.p1 GENE.GEZU01018344.1~~GEZU01018344.1.p1  ORF type:complete len:337 (-),score=35.74 GEZU01018344.1:25-933(-)
MDRTNVKRLPIFQADARHMGTVAGVSNIVAGSSALSNLSISQDDQAPKIKYVPMTITMSKARKPNEIVCTISKPFPIPPNISLAKSKKAISELSEKDAEIKVSYIRRNTKAEVASPQEDPEMDKSQWFARALKRNPDLLELLERARPLTGKESCSQAILPETTIHEYGVFALPVQQRTPSSFSNKQIGGSRTLSTALGIRRSISFGPTHSHAQMVEDPEIEEKRYKAELKKRLESVATSEVRDTLSRETLLHLIMQHLHWKNLHKTISALEEESGVKCKRVPSAAQARCIHMRRRVDVHLTN